MIGRKTELALLLKEFPAVAIIGPRQVGKSTLARQLAARKPGKCLLLDMELESDRRKLGDIESFFEANRDKTIIIDEVQLKPELFTALRPEIDALRKPGRFILTGSANPALVKGVAESLAGRIAYLHLTPFGADEVIGKKYSLQRHWFRGGYPGAFLAKNDGAFHRWMENYIQTFVQRDLSLLFDVNLSPSTIRNCWEMIAHYNGGILNSEDFGRALGISGPTVKRYLQFLEGAFLIRQLQPWYTNTSKRLVKMPKLYIRDSGVLHHLTNIHSATDMAGHITTGASWEGYVVEQIIRLLPPSVLPCFYRTHHGAEADLVLVKNSKPLACIEIKHSKAPIVSDGFYNVIDDLSTTHNFIIYTGADRYTTKNKIIVTGLPQFIAKELNRKGGII
jgi:hypothetical protein